MIRDGGAPPSEFAALLVLASVHFVNLIDFMMVMPLGPDFAGALGIQTAHLGIVGGSYTASATIVGIAGSVFLDRWERRSALTVAVVGLGISTALGALAAGMWSLIAARVLAGAFGGIAATLCFSVVADLVPEERRGRGTAMVASGFSLASILGVPAGLWLAQRGGWRTPFWVVGALALVLAAAARLLLPRLRAHLETKEAAAPLPLDERMGMAFAAFGCAILGNFLLVPNLSAFLQLNLGFPREHMWWLYLGGGLLSLVTMRIAGVVTDKYRALWPVGVGTAVVSTILVLGAVLEPPVIPPIVFFVLFMSFNAARWVSINALATRVPAPSARARYLSAQNAFGHAACAFSAFASAAFLTSDASGRLIGMPKLALTAAILGLGAPLATARLEKLVGRRKPEPAPPVFSA